MHHKGAVAVGLGTEDWHQYDISLALQVSYETAQSMYGLRVFIVRFCEK